jgi:hypothetical protein
MSSESGELKLAQTTEKNEMTTATPTPAPTTASTIQPPVSTARLTAVIYMLGVLMVVGKYLPAITAFMAALNLGLAAYDYSAGETGWMILHMLFGISSVIFLVQLYQRRNIHSYDHHHYREGSFIIRPRQEVKDRIER